MDDEMLTTFRVALDDETVAAVLEQSEAVGVAPRQLLAAAVRDLFLSMKAEGVVMARIEPGDLPPTTSRH